MSITVYLSAVSLVAPGLDGWQQSQSVLLGKDAYIRSELPKFIPEILPANERRRTTPLIKLALHVAEQCIGEDLLTAKKYATVFSSSDGDHIINDKTCRAVNLPDHPVSPTNFHNSVHNAPAGYWAIAAKAEYNSNSLSACDDSFSAGLIEAATFTAIEKKPVLYVAYDIPAPDPMDKVRHLSDTFGVGFCLSAAKDKHSMAALQIELVQNKENSVCSDSGLEILRQGNPAARSLPLLQLISSRKNETVIIPHVQSTGLMITVSPL